MASKARNKAKPALREKTREAPISPPEWPPLQPLMPPGDLTLETLLENQILVIRNFFTSTLCKKYVSFLSSLSLITTPARPKNGDALRVNDRIQFDDYAFAQQLWEPTGLQRLLCGSDGSNTEGTLTKEAAQKLWGGEPILLNPRVRVYRYSAGQFFGQHCK